MDRVVINLLKFLNQLRILHWQTNLYSQHKAFDKAYETISGLLDNLVEVHQGKYGTISYDREAIITIANKDEIDIDAILIELSEYLVTNFIEMHDSVKDTDCLNIRDEILAEINKLRYLLTLK
jgi:DNA-binding ferritin-like protein